MSGPLRGLLGLGVALVSLVTGAQRSPEPAASSGEKNATDAARAPHGMASTDGPDVLWATLDRTVVTDGGTFEIYLKSSPNPLILNQYFSVLVDVEGRDDAAPADVALTARMPQHAHGMSTRPTRERLADGQIAFRGMLFHMAGEWELKIEVARGRLRETAVAVLVVE